MSEYRRDFDKTECMSFMMKDEKLLEKYNEIFSSIIKKEFDSEPVYNEKYLTTKIKSFNGKINTNFHNNKIPKEDSQYIFLSLIFIDSFYIKDKNYYP